MSRAPNFSPLAHLYRWMEYLSFGPWLALTRSAFLDRLSDSRRALVLGDGDGRFTARLLGANPTVQIDAIDASSAMLEQLLRRAGPHKSRVRILLADIRDWEAPAPIIAPPYDLVATHFFLDCLTTGEVEALAGRLRGALATSAIWIVSEFAVPPGWQGRLVARPLVAGLYLIFGWLTGLVVRTLPDHASALRGAGFTLEERRARLAGLLISELWAAGPPNSPSHPVQARP
ncbi:MAG: class I SAM-dependent methyltransferase [Terracidiphilus sp.]|nr:class I SAM-dependent methyltransferase [Terracidiphilus sp.]